MDRSLAARHPAGRRRARGASRAGLPPLSLGALGAALRAAPSLAVEALRARRRLRVALLCMLIAMPLLGAGWLLLRHSSLVAVEHVRITGAHGPEAHAIETALREAAKGMSTLDAKPAELRAAVARFPAVSAVSESTSFPHSMRIVVTQQPAVAALLVGGTRTAISAQGTVLGTALLSPSLPTVADDVAPGPGTKVENSLVLAALEVLGAAPPALDRLAAKAYFGPRGLTVQMRNGLLVYFGDARRPHAKWLSLASVLADKASAGATYVDVRLPGRPAAGFPPGAGPASSEEGAPGESLHGASESTVSALAAGLAAANPEAKKGEPEEATSGTEAGGAEGSGEATSEPEGGSSEGATGNAERGG